MNPMRDGIARAALGPVERGGDGELSRQFRFPADFVGFAGHFPGFPLLPGIVQLLLAQCVVEDGTGRPQRLGEVNHAKFLEQVPPEATLTVRCRPRGAQADGWWSARLEIGGRTAATFQLQLAERG